MRSKRLSHWLALALLLLGAALTLQAEARPKDIVLTLDNSGSMKQNDPEFLTGVAVREFLKRLDGDSRVAIVLFDQRVRLLMPLTSLDDSTRADVLQGLEQVDRSGRLTDIPGAIERAVYELKTNGRPAADASIVLVTDGIVDTGNAAMDAEKSAWLRTDLAGDAADEGIRIFGIAFTEQADFLLIQSLSKRTSGEYFRVFSPPDIDAALEQVIAALDRPAAVDTPEPAAAPEPPASAAGPSPSPAFPADPAPPEGANGDPARAPAENITGDVAAPLAETGALAPGPETRPPPAPATAPSPVPAAPGLPWPVLAFAGLGALGLVLAILILKRRRGRQAESFPQTLPKAFLDDLSGVTGKPSYELGDNLTVIGRLRSGDADDADYVIISEPTIGRRHAMIRYRDHAFWVVDQSSLNGTFVNDKRIDGETRLKHGDRLRFYKYEFDFQQLDMLESDATMMSRTMRSEAPDEREPPSLTGTEKTTANPGVH